MKTTIRIVTIASLLLAQATGAQLPAAGASVFSMGGNGMAASRGFETIPLNAANLGFSSNPSFSLNILTAGGTSGLSPVKFNDIASYGGKLIPATVKEQWLTAIGSGSESGNIDGGLSIVSTVSHVGFQVGLMATGDMALNADASEAVLFGNAGRSGVPRNFAFNGSNANGDLFGTGAVSLGIPIMTGSHGQQLSIGVTGKYIRGLGAARAADVGSLITPDNVSVRFPAVFTDSDHVGNAGSGLGLDVGLAWTNGATSFSAAARNIVNTFAWSTSAFSASLGGVVFDGTSSSANIGDATVYSAAPASLRTALEAEKFKPEIALALSHHMGDLLLVADGAQRIGDGIEIGPKMHIGGGVEYTALGVLALRAGAAAITDGFQVAGGVGLRIGPFELGAGVSSRSRSGGGQDLGAIVSLISIQ